MRFTPARAFGAALACLAWRAAAAAGNGASATNATAAASQALVEASSPIIAFFWNSANDSDLSLEQCQGLRLQMDNNSIQRPVPPYYFTAAPVGFQPESMQVNVGFYQWFSWIPRYPPGTSITFAMTDSANQSGGSVDGYTVTDGFNNCTILSPPTNSLNVSYNPSDAPCGEIDITVNGGVPPYTFSFLSGASGLYSNATSGNSSLTRIQNPIPAGQFFTIFATDASGNSSLVSPTMTSKTGLAGCNKPTPTSTPADSSKSNSSISLGGVIGGVLAGVFLALFLLAVALWCLKRKKAKELAAEQELDANTEYLKKDGTAPLVVPFVLPARAEGSPNSVYANPFSSAENDSSWDMNQSSTFNSALHSRRPSSFGTPSPTSADQTYAYPPPLPQDSAYAQRNSAHQRSFTANTSDYHYDSTPVGTMSQADQMGSFDPQDPLSAHRYSDPYGTHEGDFGQATSVDGLAHPETFAYR